MQLLLGGQAVDLVACGLCVPEVTASLPLPLVTDHLADPCASLLLRAVDRLPPPPDHPSPLIGRCQVGDGSDLAPRMSALSSVHGTTLLSPDVGWALIEPDWRRAEVTLRADCAATYPAQALVAFALQEVAAHYGYFVIHSALVERDGLGALLCGEKTRGKSTTALALGRAGWAVRADDRCYLSPEPPPLRLWGPGGDLRLREDVVAVCPDLEDTLRAARRWAGKRRLPLSQLFAESGSGFCRPAALLFPQVCEADRHELEPLSPAVALEELLVSTGALGLPQHAAGHFAAVADLIQSAPAYRLRLGRDLAEIAPALEESLGGWPPPATR